MQLMDAAAAIFVERGFTRTQMADVAEALGVAKGTVYGSVESKEALFYATLRYADRLDEAPAPADLPVRTPGPGAMVAYLDDRLTSVAAGLRLVSVVDSTPPAEPLAELTEVLADLYGVMRRNRVALKLVDRCAVDLPELTTVWFTRARWDHVDLLATYLESRRSGLGMAEQPVDLVARMVLETLTLWAVHLPWDPAPRPYADQQIETAVLGFVTRALSEGSQP